MYVYVCLLVERLGFHGQCTLHSPATTHYVGDSKSLKKELSIQTFDHRQTKALLQLPQDNIYRHFLPLAV